MSISLLQLIETRLDEHSPGKQWLRRVKKRSAVAMILQVRAGELHILMIKRAEREGDPWSGHMAFPGGRKEPQDSNAFATALRETREEVGVQLRPEDQCIGRLSDINARHRLGRIGMTVTPYVFRLNREVTFEANEEVAEVIWVPLEFLLTVENRTEKIWRFRKRQIKMPCYRYGDREIWGLSLIMLDELMDLIEGKNPARGRWSRRR